MIYYNRSKIKERGNVNKRSQNKTTFLKQPLDFEKRTPQNKRMPITRRSDRMSFITDKMVGKTGEAIIIKLIEDIYELDVEDVSEDSEWQKVDVDLLVKDGEYQVEVKTDTSTTPNIFFETVSNRKRKTPGCMLITTADILYYVHKGHGLIFSIPVDEYRDWVMSNEFREVSVRTSNAVGLLIPIKALLESVRVITMTMNYEQITVEQAMKIINNK